MDESLDPGLRGGVEQVAQGLDVEEAEVLQGPPVADLGRAVEDPVGPGHPPAEGLGVGQVADDRLDPPAVEESGIAGGADERADAMAAAQGLLHGVTADEAGGARHEDRLGAGGRHGPGSALRSDPNGRPMLVTGRPDPTHVGRGTRGGAPGALGHGARAVLKHTRPAEICRFRAGFRAGSAGRLEFLRVGRAGSRLDLSRARASESDRDRGGPCRPRLSYSLTTGSRENGVRFPWPVH